MSTYVVLASYTERGIQHIRESPKRLDAVRRRCPDGTTVLSGEDFAKSGWFEGRVIPLAGRGLAPVAYQVRWAGKTVLVAGRIPVKYSPPAMQQLRAALAAPGGSAKRYEQSLDSLVGINPNLWLPALPVHGQNANVYDREWADVIEVNKP